MIQVKDLACRLVWDGTDEVRIPPEMGTPRADQMQGSASDRLAELAMRVCYDSLGKGRSSEDAHKHLREVGHLNPYEHWKRTVELDNVWWIDSFINRPGVWINPCGANKGIRVTLSDRVLMDWENWCWRVEDRGEGEFIDHRSSVEPTDEREQWVSLFLQGSRGFSHELVRHRHQCAVSQRSTRYVDESESEWVEHPLVTMFDASDPIKGEQMRDWPKKHTAGTVDGARRSYDLYVEALQRWLKNEKKIDGTQARKQARGAARGFLGNALLTELIFSASVAQWKHMLVMRCADAADAEIRVIFGKVLEVLKTSRYGKAFDEFKLQPASDGIGFSLAGGGHR